MQNKKPFCPPVEWESIIEYQWIRYQDFFREFHVRGHHTGKYIVKLWFFVRRCVTYHQPDKTLVCFKDVKNIVAENVRPTACISLLDGFKENFIPCHVKCLAKCEQDVADGMTARCSRIWIAMYKDDSNWFISSLNGRIGLRENFNRKP